MPFLRSAIATLLASAYAVAFLSGVGCGSTAPPEHEAAGTQLFESPQADAIIASPDGSTLYMAHTTMGVVRVINTSTLGGSTIEVGTDPVSLALRPDGSELWVANHVSDSISVISLTPGPTLHKVVETIQAIDPTNLITDFDEPVGIAFADNHKAYVALSSRNQIAVIDADTYTVNGFLSINAQEPRALVVRNGKLFVPAFESGNQSELSSCFGTPDPRDPDCTFDFTKANFAQNPQLVGFEVDIQKDPGVPDRDLFVFDTATDTQQSVVSSIGTLLYGLAVSSTGKVFIAQTDARNLADGRAGTLGQGLADLENRTFLNQIGVVNCAGVSCGAPSRMQLEPLPPSNPAPGSQLATPYGIAISADDKVLIVTAAASNRVAAIDASTGAVLDTIDVGNGPRAVALRSDPGTGAPVTAWVLNTLDNSISEIDLTGLDANPPTLVETRRKVFTNDTTPVAIRNGRIAFNSAAASTTGTFACGSCHPDGHVDQLLWVIGAQCTFSPDCTQEEARSTMPVRGLKGTLPLHWDGVLGDPFTSINGEVGTGTTAPANCTNDQSCFRHLVNAAEAGVMCDQGSCPTNNVGQAGGLSDAERDAMATYLQSVQYPPARTRRFDDQLTAQAVNGFSDFYENKGGVNPPGGGGLGPETCGDTANDATSSSGCHALPNNAGTASFFVGGFEAPTMRGITDRYLQFSGGVTNVRNGLEAAAATGATDAPWSPEIGYDEFTVWAAAFGSAAVPGAFRQAYNVGPFDIFQMIEEMSNGQSGALGRQVTLNLRSTSAGELAATQALLGALETADKRGVANLKGKGVRNGVGIELSFRSNDTYQGGGLSLTRAQLIAEAAAGTTVLTLTADQRSTVNAGTVQPTLWVPAAGTIVSNGRPSLPQFTSTNPGNIPLLQGRNIQPNAQVLIDGKPVALDAPITCAVGTLPNCTTTAIRVDLAASPAGEGMHLLQIQNPNGLLTNELPIKRNP
jgi:YVTN family beta-propeller protein